MIAKKKPAMGAGFLKKLDVYLWTEPHQKPQGFKSMIDIKEYVCQDKSIKPSKKDGFCVRA